MKRKLLLAIAAALSLCGCSDDDASSSLAFEENVSKIFDLPVVDIDDFIPTIFEISKVFDDPDAFASLVDSLIDDEHRWDSFDDDIAEIVDYLEESGDIVFLVSRVYGGEVDKGFMFLDDALISYIVYGCAAALVTIKDLKVVTVPASWVDDPLRLHVERITTTTCTFTPS